MSERAEGPGAAFWGDVNETEALQRYRTLVNAIDDGIYQLDADGRFVAVNDVILETTGYDREELVGEHVSVLLGDEDVSTIEDEIERRVADHAGRTDTFEITVRTAEGERVPCELRLNLLVEDDGVRGTVGCVREITDRKRTERVLGERERQLKRERDLIDRVLETSPVAVLVVDTDGEVTRMNERAGEILGVSDREREAYSPADRAAYDEQGRPVPVDEHPFARTLETGEPVYDRILRVERPDGDDRWLSVNAAPIMTGDGDIDRVVTTGEDITEIKERERELEHELDEVFGRVTDAFYALDDRWRFTHVNDRAEELIDYQGEGLVGENFWEVFEWGSDSKLGEEYRTTMETQEATSFELYYPAPLDAWFEINAYPSETGLSVYFQDITERKERERELERSERRYRALAEYFPNGIVTLFDHDFRYTLAAGQGFDDIPVEPDELEGRTFRDAWDDETAEALEPAFQAALDGEERSVELEYVGREWIVHAVPITDERGDVFAGMTMAQDITERKARERALEESERRYRTLVENFPNGAVGLFDEDLQYTIAGGDVLEDVGIPSEEVVGRTIWERYPDELAAQLEPNFRAALDGERNDFEIEFHDRHWLAYTLPVRNDEGDVFAGMMMVQDVTERKARERALEESERRYRTLVENFPNGAVTLVDEDFRYQTVGGTPLEEADSTIDELTGEHVQEILPPKLADLLVPRYEDAFAGESSSFEAEFDDHVYQFHVAPVRDDDGDVFAAMGMSQDVTEQKERERYLRDAKSQLEAATEAGAVGTWEWQIPEDRFVAGASFARTFGVDPDDARGGVSLDRFVSSIHADDRDRVEAEIEEAVESGGEYEAEYRVWNADGELRWVVARGHVECDDEGNPVTFPGALTDITERKRAEEALEKHRKQLETLFRVLPVGVVVADADGRLVEANEVAREIWGGDVFDAESVAEYDRYAARWADNGESVDPEEWTMSRVLQGEEVTEPDVYEIEATDGTQRIVMCHGMPVRDASGDVSRGVVTQTDITERKKRERQLQRQNDRLESFASMLAHELRNPVSIGQIYLPQATDGDESAVEEVATALDRIEATIDTLLVLARGSGVEIDPEPVTLRETATDVWSNLDAATDRLHVETDLVLDVEPSHLQHLLENLFQNAVEHGSTSSQSGANGAVEPCSTGPSSEAREGLAGRGESDVLVRVGRLEDGFYVEDNGPGIPEAERERVFEAGYTTDADGIGLGLTFVAQLADAYGWECTITESAEGGTRFEFTGVSNSRA